MMLQRGARIQKIGPPMNPTPAKRKLQRVPASAVENNSIRVDRFSQVLPQPLRPVSCTYQPRPSRSSVRPRKGQVSACNAGAMAKPVSVALTKPSRPGIIHHQGRGNSPLRAARRGTSTLKGFNMF